MNKLFVFGFTVAIVLVLVTSAQAVIILRRPLFIKDSSDTFTYKYEFNSGGTLDTLDLDGNSVNEFNHYKAEGSAIVSGGNLNMSVDGRAYDECFDSGTNVGEIWDVANPTFDSGYTVEVRLKVNSDLGKVGATTGFSFGAR